MTTTVIDEVVAELAKAMAKFPTWPTDPLHALAVLGEEFGELTKDMLQFTYEPHKGVTRDDIRTEAVQTAAMALRLAMSLSTYDYRPSPQHKQDAPRRQYDSQIVRESQMFNDDDVKELQSNLHRSPPTTSGPTP